MQNNYTILEKISVRTAYLISSSTNSPGNSPEKHDDTKNVSLHRLDLTAMADFIATATFHTVGG